MAQMTVEICIRKAWWIWPALWIVFPLHLIRSQLADRYCAWIIDKGVTPYVSRP